MSTTEPQGSTTARAAAPGYPPAEREVVHRVLAERRDVRRGFLDRPIPADVLTRVLESAHRAPSVGLSQPWDFVLVTDLAIRRKVHSLAAAQRDAFAASLPPERRSAFDGLKIEAILDAPLNIAVTCDPGRGGRHVLGRHADPRTTWFSAAIAIQNLWLAARAEGLGVGWVSFFGPAEVGAVLDLPAHVELVGYLCVGPVAEFAAAPELVRSGWAGRRPLSWAVHQESWGRRGLPGEQPGPAIATAAEAARTGSPSTGSPGTGSPRSSSLGAGSRSTGQAGTGSRSTGLAGAGSAGQALEVVVTVAADPAPYLVRPEVLVVRVGAERPAPDFGVLWRPARTVDEAVELGVEVARDLALQGVGRLTVRVVEPSGVAVGLARGLELGGLACAVRVNRTDEPGR